VTAAVARAGGSRRCYQWTLPQGQKATPSAALASLLLLLLLPVCTLAVGLSPVGVSPVGVSPVAVSPVHFSRRQQLRAARQELHCVSAWTSGALPRRPASGETLLRDCCSRTGRRLSSVLQVDFATGTKSNTVCCTCKPAATAAAAARLHAGGQPVTSRRVASRRVTSRRVASPLFATAAAQRCSSGGCTASARQPLARYRVDLPAERRCCVTAAVALAGGYRRCFQWTFPQGEKQHRSTSCCPGNSCCCCCCRPLTRWRSACHQSACHRSACRQSACRQSTVRDGCSSALLTRCCAASARQPLARCHVDLPA
jgi:hypothetical protein